MKCQIFFSMARNQRQFIKQNSIPKRCSSIKTSRNVEEWRKAFRSKCHTLWKCWPQVWFHPHRNSLIEIAAAPKSALTSCIRVFMKFNENDAAKMQNYKTVKSSSVASVALEEQFSSCSFLYRWCCCCCWHQNTIKLYGKIECGKHKTTS